MADVGLGQIATATGSYRSKKLANAVLDSLPVTKVMNEHGGVRRIPGGRTIIENALSAQNANVAWVGESGSVDLTENNVLDAAEHNWRYMLGPVTWTLAEQYQNSGENRYVDLVGAKYDALEYSMKNKFHEGILSTGTGSGGLQLIGLGALVSTTPTSGIVSGIDRSDANAAWYRNQKFDTGADWAEGGVDAGNVKRFLDKGINYTMENSTPQVQVGLLGLTHFEYLTQALQAIQVISNVSTEAKAGFDKLIYRGVPMYLSYGLNYSGYSQQTATRSYLLNVKPGGFNIVYHEKAEFALLNPVDANDQAAVSRLMFMMGAATLGGLAKRCWVGFD